jgi:hypothetical protein
MNYDTPNLAAGLGIGAIVLGIVLYLAGIALALWIGYLVIRTAVKNGILRADAERAARGYGGPTGYAGPPVGGTGPGTP